MRFCAVFIIILAAMASYLPILAQNNNDKLEEAYFLSVFSADFAYALAEYPQSTLQDCALSNHMIGGLSVQAGENKVGTEFVTESMWQAGVFKQAALVSCLSSDCDSSEQLTPFRELVYEAIDKPSELVGVITPKLKECRILYKRHWSEVVESVSKKSPIKLGAKK